jgi:hypothetical protein
MSSIRRAFPRNAPPSGIEEMRPILHPKKGGNNSSVHLTAPGVVDHRSKSRTSTTTVQSSSIPCSASSHPMGESIHNANAAYEFSVRDYSDATAKRGFRVQIPKRILLYTVIVFFILPIVLFVYVEVHKKSTSSNSHSEHHKERYHQYDKSKIFPNLLQVDDPDNNEGSNVTTLNIADEEDGKIFTEESVGDKIGDGTIIVTTTSENTEPSTVHEPFRISNETSTIASGNTMSVNTEITITNNDTVQSEQFNNSTNPIEIIHSLRNLRGID